MACPSTVTGEFTISEAVADIAAVLDGLGWDAAYVMGHSWGGHLVFHAAVAIPERIAGVLSVDPLGAVGDGGMEALEPRCSPGCLKPHANALACWMTRTRPGRPRRKRS